MSGLLATKRILVTGAGKGIGKALCLRLAEAGANVIALGRCADQLEQLQAECPRIQTVLADLQDWKGTRDALQHMQIPGDGKLDGLVNNAGIAIIKDFADLSEKDIDDTFDVNIKAIFNVTQALLPRLQDGSSIVMVSSVASDRSFAGHTAYSATKAALDSLTRSLALELGPRRIRVNSVNPTVVLTQMGRANWSSPEKADPLLAHIPLRRFCEVDEVVDGIVYLLSKQSSFVNGHHLPLEGGYSVS